VAPIVHTSIGGTRIVSRLTAGYRHRLLVPSTTTAERYATAPAECSPGQRFSSARREWHSGLGNAITCDDHVALVHPDVDRETEEIIADVLKVEGLTMLVSQSSLFGI